MFVKGQSGNPGGRPKGSAELRDLAQRLTARKAITGGEDDAGEPRRLIVT